MTLGSAHPVRAGAGGFTLVEVLIAMMLVATMAASTAALFGVAVESSRRARGQTSATVLAIQKLEQLRALSWGSAVTGELVTDATSDLSRDPPSSGGAGLGASPAGSLDVNTSGYVDYLDALGRWVGTGASPPPPTVWARRWSVRPSPGNADTLILQVLVVGLGRRSGDVHLLSVKTRKGE